MVSLTSSSTFIGSPHISDLFFHLFPHVFSVGQFQAPKAASPSPPPRAGKGNKSTGLSGLFAARGWPMPASSGRSASFPSSWIITSEPSSCRKPWGGVRLGGGGGWGLGSRCRPNQSYMRVGGATPTSATLGGGARLHQVGAEEVVQMVQRLPGSPLCHARSIGRPALNGASPGEATSLQQAPQAMATGLACPLCCK